MKTVSDLSIFHWDAFPAPAYFRGMESFQVRSRRAYRMRPISAGTGVDDLLGAECFCEVQWRRGARYLRRNSPFLTLEYVLKGELLVRQENRGYILGPGELFLMQPCLESELLCSDGGCHKISVMIVGTLLKEYLNASGLGKLDVITHLDRRHLERLLQQFSDLAEQGDKPAPEENAALTYELLQYLRTPSGLLELPKPLALLHSALETHPEYAWTQTEMAERCHCTPIHLSRLFRKYFGTTPYRMLLDLRIARAKHLLAREELAVKEVAEMVGYANALNFSTEFRKRAGMSPSEYRRHISWLS